MQARSKIKMTGGAERVPHINPPSCFGPTVKAYLPAIVVDGSKSFSFRGCSLIRIVSSTTPGSVSLVHGFTHDKSVPCLFSTCLGSCSEALAKTL